MERRSNTACRPRVISIPVHFVQSQQTQSASALKIQKAFRGFLVRKSVKQIKTIWKDVVEIERRIGTVKEVGRIDEKERLRLNEMLMALLFKLDSVRGICNGVRDCRKRVIKKVIALQEKVDSISDVTVVKDFEPDPEEVAVEEETKMIAPVDSTDISAAPESAPDQVQTEFEGEKKTNELPEKDDIAAVEEEKKTNLMQPEEVDYVPTAGTEEVAMDEEEEPKTIHCVMEEDRALPDDHDHGNGGKNSDVEEEMEREEKERKRRGRDDYLLERMVEENEKLVGMMKELNEKNELQMRLLNSLAQRVELLEKTVVCDKLARMKKKKRHGNNGPNNNNNF